MYVNKTEICKFKDHEKRPWYNFCLGSVSKYFTKNETSEISLNVTAYDFSVDQSPVQKEEILNIHVCLMKKNTIK